MKLFLIALFIFIPIHISAADNVVTLGHLIEQTLENNPEIKASGSRFEASTKRPSQEGALPNPTIGVKYRNAGFDEITLGENQMTNLEFSLRQEVPFPGKLSLREDIAETRSDMQRWKSEAVARNVLSDLKKTYYNWFLVHRSVQITEKNRELLKRLTKIAEKKYELGKGIQQDVTKAQVELSKFIEKLEILKNREKIIKARLRQITNIADEKPLGKPVEELKKTDFNMKPEKILEIAKSSSPELNSKNEMIKMQSESLELARKELYPDLILSTAYANRGIGDDSLDDIWEVGIGFRVPLYFRSREIPAVEEAAINLTESRHEYSDTANKLKYRINEFYLTAETADKLTDLYKDGIIPQAKLSLNSSISAYQVGKIDFLTMLDDMIKLFTFELEYYRKLADYQTALANLEEISGVNIIEHTALPGPALKEGINETEQ